MSGKLNILIITSRADFGGGPEHIYRLIRCLNEKVFFFIACPDDYPYYDLYSEIVGKDNLIKIPHRKFRCSALFRLLLFTIKNKVDIIHSHGKGAGIYGRFLSFLTFRKCIHTFHGIHINNYSLIKKIIYLKIERLLSLITNRFISVSESEFETASGMNMAPANQIKIIYNGTLVIEKKSESGFDSEVYEIVTLTRFDYAKNTLLLIPVCKEINKIKSEFNFRFTIIGSGEDEEKFKRKITEEKLERSFHLTGFIKNTGEYLNKAFCYISTSRWEGLPLGVLEAMSYGLPVIATDVQGNKDLVLQEYNGFLFNISEPGEAAEYIIRLAGNSELYKQMSENGKKLIEEKFSMQKMCDETFNLYHEVSL